jgi:hypothetical protein
MATALGAGFSFAPRAFCHRNAQRRVTTIIPITLATTGHGFRL